MRSDAAAIEAKRSSPRCSSSLIPLLAITSTPGTLHASRSTGRPPPTAKRPANSPACTRDPRGRTCRLCEVQARKIGQGARSRAVESASLASPKWRPSVVSTTANCDGRYPTSSAASSQARWFGFRLSELRCCFDSMNRTSGPFHAKTSHEPAPRSAAARSWIFRNFVAARGGRGEDDRRRGRTRDRLSSS